MNNDNQMELVKIYTMQYNNLSRTARFLEQMASEGWMLQEIIGRMKFRFRKCEPRKLSFSVDIFSEGSEYDTHLLENNLEYIDYCESVGWKFVCASGVIHIFCTEENAPEIDSDQSMKLNTIHKLLGKRKLVLGGLMCILALFQVLMSLTVNLNLVEQQTMMFSSLVLWSFVMTIWGIQLIAYGAWYWRARKAIANGEKMPESKLPGYRLPYSILILFAVLHMGGLCLAGVLFREPINFLVFPIWGMVFGLIYVSGKITVYAEKKKVGKERFKLLTLAVSVFCTLLIIAIVMVATVSIMSAGDKYEQPVTHISDATVFTVEGQPFERYTEHYSLFGSFLMKNYQFVITGRTEGKPSKDWYFQVHETPIGAIHDRLLREADFRGFYRNNGVQFDLPQATEYTAFQTGDVKCYEAICGEEYRYLLYDSDTIVTLRAPERLSGDQFAVIGQSIFQSNMK